jgi:hypothetical protein
VAMIFKPPSLLLPRSFPPLASTLDAGAAVAFTSEQNAVRYLPAHRICYSHLLDLQPCWLLLGLAPTGKRRLFTAHTRSGH